MSIFRLLNLVQLQLRSASESIQQNLIIWVGLNSNEVRLMKSSASEPSLKDCIKVQGRKKKVVVLCSRPRQDVKLGIFTSLSCNERKEMCKKE